MSMYEKVRITSHNSEWIEMEWILKKQAMMVTVVRAP